MTSLPNPFLSFAGASPSSADSAAAPSPLVPTCGAAASPFADEPLPLCLTEPHPLLERELAALVSAIFGIHNAPGLA